MNKSAEKIVYEYLAVFLSGQTQVQEEELNAAGRLGWKLVNVTAAYDSEDDCTYCRAYFIREKS